MKSIAIACIVLAAPVASFPEVRTDTYTATKITLGTVATPDWAGGERPLEVSRMKAILARSTGRLVRFEDIGSALRYVMASARGKYSMTGVDGTHKPFNVRIPTYSEFIDAHRTIGGVVRMQSLVLALGGGIAAVSATGWHDPALIKQAAESAMKQFSPMKVVNRKDSVVSGIACQLEVWRGSSGDVTMETRLWIPRDKRLADALGPVEAYTYVTRGSAKPELTYGHRLVDIRKNGREIRPAKVRPPAAR